jgi:RNA polymerase sigma factor (sigma-70 family)
MSLGPAVRQLAARVAADDARRLTDAELVRRFAADRDEAAFAALTERHGPMVRAVCRRLLGHAQDAEDAAQAVFLVLARNAARVRKQASVAAWLHGVATRVCRKALSRRPKQLAEPGPPPEAIPDRPAGDSDALTWADARRVIDDALAALPESLRLPLVLCYLQGLTRDEAATQLGWSLSTLRGRLERGRERLRAELLRRGVSLSVGLATVLLSESAATAAPGWSAAVARAATGQAPVSAPVDLLTHGAVPIMTRKFLLFPAVLLAGSLVAGLASQNSGGRESPGSPGQPPPKPAGKVFQPEPKAPAVAEKLKGTWVGSITSPDGTTTRQVKLRFVDGSHLVETITQTSPGVRASVIIRFRYELKDGELKLVMLEKYNGDEQSNEPVPLRDADREPREFTFKWVTEGGKTGFRRVHKADPDSPWAAVTFVRTEDKPAADPPVPEALRNLDWTIRKEPTYSGTPLYLLLAFGPEAKFRVWVVLDGTTLYVDRNGNGDLTDPGERVEPAMVPGEANARSPAFLIGDLTDPAGAKHTDFFLSGIRMTTTGAVYPRLGVRVDGRTLQMAGPANLQMAGSPKEARVVHFGSPVVTARPSLSMPSTPDANGPADFRVQVGTPGVGPGSFASFGNGDLPEGVGPLAEFEFDPVEPGGAPKKVTLKLTERCCGDQFFAKLTVPVGVKAGVNAAKVTLSFPGCPWGKVEPVTYPVDVIPKSK